MSRVDILTYIAVALVAGMVLLNTAIIVSPDVYAALAKGGSHENLLGHEIKWAYESVVWTSMFAFAVLAIFIYLYHLRRYADRFQK
jgi:hypothetical protein